MNSPAPCFAITDKIGIIYAVGTSVDDAIASYVEEQREKPHFSEHDCHMYECSRWLYEYISKGGEPSEYGDAHLRRDITYLMDNDDEDGEDE